MEFLNGIVESVKTGNLGAIMTVMGAFAFFLTVITQLSRFISAIASWKIWGWLWRRTGQWAWRTSKHLYLGLLAKYRRWRANRIMKAQIQERVMSVNAQAFERSLTSDPRSSTRLHFGHLTPEKPRWLNDYYVANALETLSREGAVMKAREYERLAWPPSVVSYKIWPSTRIDLFVDEFETDGLCRAYQHFRHCPLDDRFEEIRRAETVAVNRTVEDWQYPVRETAPPCERCWEKDDRRWGIQQLVRRLTCYDFWRSLTPEMQKNISHLQEQISAVCVECGCELDLENFKRIVERAIEIRRGQLDSLGLGRTTECTNQLTVDFSTALSEYIREELELTADASDGDFR